MQKIKRVSVPCRGLTCFYANDALSDEKNPKVSVPCRGLTCFYSFVTIYSRFETAVSVPCRGLTCFYSNGLQDMEGVWSFRPLSGSYMFLCRCLLHERRWRNVSVPCRGLTCFYSDDFRTKLEAAYGFPSPVGVLHVSIIVVILIIRIALRSFRPLSGSYMFLCIHHL